MTLQTHLHRQARGDSFRFRTPKIAWIHSSREVQIPETILIRKGDIQAVVEVASLSGSIITSIITSDSLARIGLKTGMLITAELWTFFDAFAVILHVD